MRGSTGRNAQSGYTEWIGGREIFVVRSNRKSIAVQVKKDGQIVVRAPQRMAKQRIREFVAAHEAWIEKTQSSVSQLQESRREITEQERIKGIETAKTIIPERVAYFAQRMGVTYNRITIREQKTRWGSCSSRGNLNFNWQLVRTSPELLDYVVVHELAHRREMNHSAAFWAIVEHELPDYRERRRKLKEYTL